MLEICVATHGDLALALVRTAFRIAGSGLRLHPVCLYDNVSGFERELREALAGRDARQQLILVDLAYGTPWNIACKLNMCPVVAGVNLAMLLEAYSLPPDINAKEAADTLAASARCGITLWLPPRNT
ncbi:MAG: hypothetical protein AB1497_00035 [Bacillota bacterium]